MPTWNLPTERQFLNVVHQAIELPLAIDLPPPAKREPVQPLVVSDVAEDRFDGGKASPVAGHDAFLSSTSGLNLVIPDRSRHDAAMTIIYLHRR